MSEEISREEIAALLARESMSKEITREQAIGVITMHREHWRRLLQGNVCSKVEGEESIASFDLAIAALSTEPCEDAISRQAVLALPRNKVRDFKTMEVVCETINVTDIETLPPVNPQEPNMTWVTGADGAKIAFKDVPVWKVTKICEILGEPQESEEV